MDAFKFMRQSPVKLSDTIYSETIDSLKEARKNRDLHWLCELYVEAFILLEDVELVNRNKTASIGRYEELLQQAHLDAQVPIPTEPERFM